MRIFHPDLWELLFKYRRDRTVRSDPGDLLSDPPQEGEPVHLLRFQRADLLPMRTDEQCEAEHGIWIWAFRRIQHNPLPHRTIEREGHDVLVRSDHVGGDKRIGKQESEFGGAIVHQCRYPRNGVRDGTCVADAT